MPSKSSTLLANLSLKVPAVYIFSPSDRDARWHTSIPRGQLVYHRGGIFIDTKQTYGTSPLHGYNTINEEVFVMLSSLDGCRLEDIWSVKSRRLNLIIGGNCTRRTD